MSSTVDSGLNATAKCEAVDHTPHYDKTNCQLTGAASVLIVTQ